MRTLAVAAITGLIALAMASVASAAPTVSLVWTGTTGAGAVGGSSIAAAVGDTLTLDILVTGDATGVTAAALSYDTSLAGVASAYTRPTFDSINDGNFDSWDFQGSGGNTLAPASATYTGGALTYIDGSGVICPAGTGNLMAGICGMASFLLPNPGTLVGDLGGGITGSFGTNPGGPTPGTWTLAQAQFEVVPEPATGGLLALGLGALAFIGRRRA